MPPTKLKPRSSGCSNADRKAGRERTRRAAARRSARAPAHSTGNGRPVASCRRLAQTRSTIAATTATNAATTIRSLAEHRPRHDQPRLFRKTSGGPIQSARPRSHCATTCRPPSAADHVTDARSSGCSPIAMLWRGPGSVPSTARYQNRIWNSSGRLRISST